MVQLSIFDKIGILLQVFFSSKLPILFIILFGVFYYLKKIRKEFTKKQILIGYSIFTFLVFLLYYKELFAGFDYIMTNILTGYYFPDFALYLVILITSHIIFFSIFYFKQWTKQIKILFTVQFIVIETIFLLFLYTVSKYHLDLGAPLKLYQNKEVLSLLELTTFVLCISILIFIVLFIIDKDKILKQHTKKIEKEIEVPVTVVSKIDKEMIVETKENPIIRKNLENLKETLKNEETIFSHELRMLGIKQKKDLLKIYKKTIQIRMSTSDESEYDIQEELDELESILDDSEINVEQNIDEYIDKDRKSVV